MAAEVGCPEAAQIVFESGDEAPERHVAALVPEATIRGVDAVVEDAWAIFVESLESLDGPVDAAASGSHRNLTHLCPRGRAAGGDPSANDSEGHGSAGASSPRRGLTTQRSQAR